MFAVEFTDENGDQSYHLVDDATKLANFVRVNASDYIALDVRAVDEDSLVRRFFEAM